jgi:hypothetical protein
MSNQKHVKTFLGRLESSVNDRRGSFQAMQGRETKHLAPYMQSKTWPGKEFMYIGHSQNLEHPLVGTEIHVQRSTCLALLFEAKGNKNYCVRVDDALKFNGFRDVLSRFEADMLRKMPPHTMIGPAYNENGELMATTFTVWRALAAETKKSKVLAKA